MLSFYWIAPISLIQGSWSEHGVSRKDKPSNTKDDKWASTRENLSATKAQTSLCIRAVLSAPLLVAFWKALYLNLLQAKFQFSS